MKTNASITTAVRHRHRAVFSIATATMMVAFFLYAIIICQTSSSAVHATTIPTTTPTVVGRLRGQNQRQQLLMARQHQRQHPMQLQPRRRRLQQQQQRHRLEKQVKNTNDESNKSNPKVALVTSMLKTENAKRKEANQKLMTMIKNKDKKRKAKSQKNQSNQQQQNQQRDYNKDSITISVTQPTRTASTKATATTASTTAADKTITTTTTPATTTAATTKTTTNTMVPDIGMLPIKCAVSISSYYSYDGTTTTTPTTKPECPAQHFCKLDSGTCTATSSSSSSNTEMIQYYGTCQPQPTICSRKLNPVCGCDGITYNSECIAHSVGVSVSSTGDCPKTTTTTTTTTTTSTSNNNDSTGGDTIIIVPNIGTVPTTKCIILLDNQKTFTSSSTSSPTCPEDQFCQLETGSCTSTANTSAAGSCQPRPMLCTLMYSPVCGCDGRTYGSACAAHGVGMSVAYEGECATSPTTADKSTPVIVPESAPVPPPIKCTIDPTSSATVTTCPPDQFCQLETGACGDSPPLVPISGTCQSKPSVCISLYDPVCGCDGRTHDNMCSAHGAGVSVSYTGECHDITTTTAVATTTTTIPPMATLVDKGEDDGMMFNMFQGPCTSDTQCAGELVCHSSSSNCVCNESTNEGCPIAGQLCGVNPGLYCGHGEEEQGCLPSCSCDYTSPFPAIFTDNETDGDATSNGCEVGEVCRMPCAMADAAPTCFKSEIQRDCRSGYVCADGNGDGIINQNDGGHGCVEVTASTITAATTTEAPATVAPELPCRIVGHCRSPSGVCEPSVTCIADPCRTASCAANYVCEANYCGGCHASCVLAAS